MQRTPNRPPPRSLSCYAGQKGGTTVNTYRVYEFRSDEWAAYYSKRDRRTIARAKSAGVPVFWVGLPSIRSDHRERMFLDDRPRSASNTGPRLSPTSTAGQPEHRHAGALQRGDGGVRSFGIISGHSSSEIRKRVCVDGGAAFLLRRSHDRDLGGGLFGVRCIGLGVDEAARAHGAGAAGLAAGVVAAPRAFAAGPAGAGVTEDTRSRTDTRSFRPSIITMNLGLVAVIARGSTCAQPDFRCGCRNGSYRCWRGSAHHGEDPALAERVLQPVGQPVAMESPNTSTLRSAGCRAFFGGGARLKSTGRSTGAAVRTIEKRVERAAALGGVSKLGEHRNRHERKSADGRGAKLGAAAKPLQNGPFVAINAPTDRGAFGAPIGAARAYRSLTPQIVNLMTALG